MLNLSSISVAPPWLWTSFLIGIVILLFLDLVILQRKPHRIHLKEALLTSLAWILLALAFNFWFSTQYGIDLGVEFLTGYLVEKSLSLDNLFVIFMIFQSFRIPPEHQHRVLFYGILGAVLMRGGLIIVGAKLIQEFHWILYAFGLFLVITAIRFLRKTESQEDFTHSKGVQLLTRIIPLSSHLQGKHFFVFEDGKTKMTRLFLALVLIEGSDLIFAFDSIPAVFAITADPFIAFASNILAVLGLRALYFAVADLVVKIHYLKPGLALVLGFVGLKMLLMDVIKIPSWVSLIVIVGILTLATLISAYVSRIQNQSPRA